MNPKLFRIMITILILLTVVGVAAVVVVLNLSGEAKGKAELSLDEMVDYSFTSSDMSTDLKDGSFVRIQLQLITNSRDAKKEVEKREFQLKNLFIKESVKLTSEDFKVGLNTLEEKLRTEMNQYMEEGEIVEVYIINKILQ